MALPLVLRWGLLSLGPTLALKRSAKAGEIGPRLATDKLLWRDPFPWYDAMRAQGDLNRGRVTSASASYDVCRDVLRSPTFRVGIDSDALPLLVRKVFLASIDGKYPGPAEPPSMLGVDPPDHTRYRRLVSKVFTARAVAALEPRVEKIADELLDEMAKHDPAHGPLDLVEHYAAPLPVRIISEILGVPDHMQNQMLEWGNAAAVTLDPAMSYRTFKRAHVALRELHTWLGGHLEHLRRNPGDDLLSQLATLTDEGETLSDVELRSTALLVLGAGFETTVNLIGNGVMALLTNPDQLGVLRDDPTCWGNATDEVLRWDSPVQVTVRFASEDTQICGERIDKGTVVTMMIGGANRDPRVFPDPHTFDVRRGNARDHLAFSAGIHFCLGASLARLEGAVALRRLFERFPDLAVAGDPVRRPLRVLRGYEHLPVRLAR
jgi:cytochrome P450